MRVFVFSLPARVALASRAGGGAVQSAWSCLCVAARASKWEVRRVRSRVLSSSARETHAVKELEHAAPGGACSAAPGGACSASSICRRQLPGGRDDVLCAAPHGVSRCELCHAHSLPRDTPPLCVTSACAAVVPPG